MDWLVPPPNSDNPSPSLSSTIKDWVSNGFEAHRDLGIIINKGRIKLTPINKLDESISLTK